RIALNARTLIPHTASYRDHVCVDAHLSIRLCLSRLHGTLRTRLLLGTVAYWWHYGPGSMGYFSVLIKKRNDIMSSNVDYPGATKMIITDPAWVFTDALTGVPNADLTIVNHKTANNGPTDAQGIARFFHNDTAGHKSAHFVVG